MFKVGGIYKFECIPREEGFFRNYDSVQYPLGMGWQQKLPVGVFLSRTLREYATSGGLHCPDILVEERCTTNAISENGYYRVLDILGEKAVRTSLGGIARYDMELRLEKASGLNWLREQTPKQFIEPLKQMGFYVDQRDMAHPGKGENADDETSPGDQSEIGLFAVDPRRGIIIQGETSDMRFHSTFSHPGDVSIRFIHPGTPTLRRLAYQVLSPLPLATFSGTRDFLSNEAPFPMFCTGQALHIRDFAPDILDVIERNEMKRGHKEPHVSSFDMPFVYSPEHEGEFIAFAFGDGPRYPYSPEEYEAYYKQCRAVFASFPVEIQKFLLEYTKVASLYLEGEPWKRFVNKPRLPF